MEYIIRQIITLIEPECKYWSHHTQDELSGKFCFAPLKQNKATKQTTHKKQKVVYMLHKSPPRRAMKFIPPQQLIWLSFQGLCFLVVTCRIRTRYCSPVYQQKFCHEFRRKQSQPVSKGYMKGQLLNNCSLTSKRPREEKSNTKPTITFKWRFWNTPGGTKITEGASLGRSIELHESIT